MNRYKVTISPFALSDIQEITNWYNKCLPKLGTRFQQVVKQQIGALRNNANAYSIRYKNVRCMFVRKFPYLVHLQLDEASRHVEIFAVIHTSRNPDIWEEKTKDI